MRGPLNPSINYEVGLLIEGYDYPPALMMAYNPPYYPGFGGIVRLQQRKGRAGFPDRWRIPASGVDGSSC